MSRFWIFLIYKEFLIIISTGVIWEHHNSFAHSGLDAPLWSQATGSYFLLKTIGCHWEVKRCLPQSNHIADGLVTDRSTI